jgi:hypothetical protein
VNSAGSAPARPRDVPSGAQIDDTGAVRSNAPPVEPAKLAKATLTGHETRVRVAPLATRVSGMATMATVAVRSRSLKRSLVDKLGSLVRAQCGKDRPCHDVRYRQ